MTGDVDDITLLFCFNAFKELRPQSFRKNCILEFFFCLLSKVMAITTRVPMAKLTIHPDLLYDNSQTPHISKFAFVERIVALNAKAMCDEYNLDGFGTRALEYLTQRR